MTTQQTLSNTSIPCRLLSRLLLPTTCYLCLILPLRSLFRLLQHLLADTDCGLVVVNKPPPISTNSSLPLTIEQSRPLLGLDLQNFRNVFEGNRETVRDPLRGGPGASPFVTAHKNRPFLAFNSLYMPIFCCILLLSHPFIQKSYFNWRQTSSEVSSLRFQLSSAESKLQRLTIACVLAVNSEKHACKPFPSLIVEEACPCGRWAACFCWVFANRDSCGIWLTVKVGHFQLYWHPFCISEVDRISITSI